MIRPQNQSPPMIQPNPRSHLVSLKSVFRSRYAVFHSWTAFGQGCRHDVCRVGSESFSEFVSSSMAGEKYSFRLARYWIYRLKSKSGMYLSWGLYFETCRHCGAVVWGPKYSPIIACMRRDHPAYARASPAGKSLIDASMPLAPMTEILMDRPYCFLAIIVPGVLCCCATS